MGLHVQQRTRTPFVGVGVPGGGQQGHETGQGLQHQLRILPGGAAPGVSEAREPVPQTPLVQRLAVEQREHALREVVPLQQTADAKRVEALPPQHAGCEPVQVQQVRLRLHADAARHRDDLLRSGRLGKRVVDLAGELLGGHPFLADDRVRGERHAEHLRRHVQDAPGRRARSPRAERRGGRHGADPPQRTVRPRRADRRCQPAQQHGHVGALRAVVGVELVQHHVRDVRALPQGPVLAALQEQVQHLVVGDQHVRRGDAHLLAPGQDPSEVGVRPVADVQTRGHLGEVGRRQVVADAARLVGGQRVHRIQEYGLHTAPPESLLPSAMVENRHQERLSLAGTRAGRHERRLGLPAAQRAEPLPCLGLVPPRCEPGQPLQMPFPPVVRLVERRPDPQIRPPEDPRLRVPQEPLQGPPGVVVGQRVGRREVLRQTAPQLRGGQSGLHDAPLRPWIPRRVRGNGRLVWCGSTV